MKVHQKVDVIDKIDECINEAIVREYFDTAYLLRVAKMNFILKTHNISNEEFDYILSVSRRILHKKRNGD